MARVAIGAALLGLLPVALLAATSDQNLVTKTRDRIKENQIKPADRKMDRIGWVPTLPEALRLAKQHNRPVFFLLHYGSMESGRCDGDSFTFRGVALNSDSIISTLNEFYVPVYRSWDDLGPSGNASEEERQVFRRIVADAEKKKVPIADVRVYILSPDGSPTPASFGMSDPFKILKGLLQVVMELKTPQGQILVKPKVQSAPASIDPPSLVLHTVARGLGTGNWRLFPAENWITLKKEQWTGLLPSSPARPGMTWKAPEAAASAILTTFYPATEEDSRKDRNRIQKISWNSRVISVEDGVAIARVEATMKAKRSFYPGKETTDTVDVKAEGFVRFAADLSDVFSLALSTTSAYYEDEEFIATVEDVKELPQLPEPEPKK